MESLISLNSKKPLKTMTFDFIQKMLKIYSKLLISMVTESSSMKNF